MAKLLWLLPLLANLVCELSEAQKRARFGQLMLCPPGGESFNMAWTLACEMMKRRKRDVDQQISAEDQEQNQGQKSIEDAIEKRTPRGFRPATLNEIKKICCEVGCDIRDIGPYCVPF